MIKKRAGRKLDSVLERKQILFICDRGWLSILDGCCQTPHAVLLSRGRKKTNLHPFDLAPYWGLPSQYLSILLVRSYRTFAPLPNSFVIYHLSFISFCCLMLNVQCSMKRRYFSVALSSRSLALGVIQQAWSFGSPDFPQVCLKDKHATTSPTLFSIYLITLCEN